MYGCEEALLLLVLIAQFVVVLRILYRLDRIETRFRRWREEDPAGEQRSTSGAPAPPSPPHAAAEAPVPEPPAPVAPAPTRSMAKPAGAEQVRRQEGRREGLESLIGRRWLVRVGALSLLLGLGFLYKLSVERGWISPAARVGLGGGVGLVLWWLGHGFRLRGYGNLAQGFAGAGSAVLYLSVYASHAMYDLVGTTPAFGLMVTVTAGTVWVSLRHEALSLAILAQVGGLLTPLLVGESRTGAHVMFAYLLVLDVGMIVLGARKGWRALLVIGWAGTALLFFLRVVSESLPETSWWVGISWAGAFALLFLMASTLGALRRRACVEIEGAMTIGLGAPWWLAMTLLCLRGTHTDVLAGCLVLMAAVHLALSEALQSRVREDSVGRELLRLPGAAFLILAAPAFFSGRPVTLSWAILGCVLAWWAEQRRSLLLSIGSWVAFALALGAVLLTHMHFTALDWGVPFQGPEIRLFWNPDFGVSLSVVAALACAAWLAGRQRQALASTCALALLAVLGRECELLLAGEAGEARLEGASRLLTWALTCAVGSMGFAANLRRQGTSALLVLASLLGMTAALLSCVALQTLQLPATVLIVNARCITILTVAGLLLLVHARMALPAPGEGKDARFDTKPLRVFFEICGLGLALLVLSTEAFRFFERRAPADVAVQGGQAALSVTWALYAALLLILGITRRRGPLRIAGLALFGLTVAKVGLVDLASLDTVYRVASFLVLGVLLMGAAWMYHRFEIQLTDAPPPATGAGQPAKTDSEQDAGP